MSDDFSPVVTAFDDQDAYKFFMQYAVLQHYPEACVRYSLILRDTSVVFPVGFAEALKKQVNGFAAIRFMPDMERHMTESFPWFDTWYLQYLRAYRFDPSEVHIDQPDGHLTITIEGLWPRTILWEVPLMACLSELYYRMLEIPDDVEKNIPRWEKKFSSFREMNLSVIEFGTRRRKSLQVQEMVLETFLRTAPETIKGTSNVMFARRFNIPARGTQAHEWIMFHGALSGMENANRQALGKWVDTYHGALGIALTDTYTTDRFFRDFDLLYSKLFDGIRQDSGDPVAFTMKAIRHYLDKDIVLPDGRIPKTIVFSDSIDSIGKLGAMEEAVKGRIFSSYGIGTWLTNDILGTNGRAVQPLNMVIKLTAARPNTASMWIPCFKLTDSREKQTGKEGNFPTGIGNE